MFTLRGRPAGDVALPGIGALGWALNGRHSAPELWYSFTSFLFPETVYRHDLSKRREPRVPRPRALFDPGAYETRQVFTRPRTELRSRCSSPRKKR
jgi:prolyl oligopeptidase